MLLALLLAASPKIAVLDVRAGQGVDAALAPYLTQVLAQEVADRTGQAPLVSADITAMLGFERNKRMLGCTEEDSACLAEITNSLGVSEVVASSVAVSGGRYLLSVARIDVRKAQPLKRVADSTAHDDEELVKLVRRAAWKLYGGKEPVAAVVVAPVRPASRRPWALAAGGAAIALATTGAIVGANALSQARADSPTAKPRAHLADALYAGAAVCAGVGVWLWVSDKAAASARATPDGAMASLEVAW